MGAITINAHQKECQKKPIIAVKQTDRIAKTLKSFLILIEFGCQFFFVKLMFFKVFFTIFRKNKRDNFVIQISYIGNIN